MDQEFISGESQKSCLQRLRSCSLQGFARKPKCLMRMKRLGRTWRRKRRDSCPLVMVWTLRVSILIHAVICCRLQGLGSQEAAMDIIFRKASKDLEDHFTSDICNLLGLFSNGQFTGD